ncbi:hypothetical protein H5410_012420 [Solanum commersonii]|uniref:Uncharacterized protein n=1 Tax=Solanum commersonii TaxID=4109 RepID=A0A9J6ASK6_SOLCO|nr:hypothetical protein H5410_012420 [Solanum commersonii]
MREVVIILRMLGFTNGVEHIFQETVNNAMFNEAREFPIITLFNDISKRWSKKFHERRMAYAKLKTTFVPSAETKIMANKNLENKLLVHQIDEDTFSVTG